MDGAMDTPRTQEDWMDGGGEEKGVGCIVCYKTRFIKTEKRE
jgi:hypothetical protein